MLFTDVISKKRDGHALSDQDIENFVSGLADGSLPAEQVAALAMAICLRSMSFAETACLTTRMAHSGAVLEWDVDGPVVDKHSTGGIGDKVSLVLAPIAAACGCFVPMISGRGLGHTGGTLDKMDSIPGYQTAPTLDEFRSAVRETGCAIIGQTPDLAPADRRLYAIRDVTATVESIPLITASILSKKIAAGTGSLVLDVKTGSGAFMATADKARRLAESIIATAGEAGLPTHALITDMNECLGSTAGNALEVMEAVDYLRDRRREGRLDEVTVALASRMLMTCGLATDDEQASRTVRAAITSGSAAEVFARMIARLGGPADFMTRAESYLPGAPVSQAVPPPSAGYLVAVDTKAVGHAIIQLGGGRRRASDTLDLSVGFSEMAAIGDEVSDARPLAVVHAASDDDARAAASELRSACRIDVSPPAQRPVIHAALGPDDVKGGRH